MADVIERFLEGTATDYEWDDFICVRVRDPQLEKLRLKCVAVAEEFPGGPPSYCNDEGITKLREVLSELRSEAERNTRESLN